MPLRATDAHEKTIRQKILALVSEAIQQDNYIALLGIAGKEVTAVETIRRCLLVRYEKYHAVNFSLPQPYKGSKISAEVEQKLDELVHPPPSSKLVDLSMAELLVECIESNKKYEWADLHIKALRGIWLRRYDWESHEKEMSGKLEKKPIL